MYRAYYSRNDLNGNYVLRAVFHLFFDFSDELEKQITDKLVADKADWYTVESESCNFATEIEDEL